MRFLPGYFGAVARRSDHEQAGCQDWRSAQMSSEHRPLPPRAAMQVGAEAVGSSGSAGRRACKARRAPPCERLPTGLRCGDAPCRQSTRQIPRVRRTRDQESPRHRAVGLRPAQADGDGEMLRRGVRAVLEHVTKGGGAQARLTIVGRALPAGGELIVRSSEPPDPLVPPVAEERPSGDPLGTVLGYALAETVFSVHGGKLQEREGALVISFPKR